MLVICPQMCLQIKNLHFGLMQSVLAHLHYFLLSSPVFNFHPFALPRKE